MGRAHSTGDPSQQGLLPEVYHTASTGRCAHLHDRMLNKPTNYQQRTDPRACVRVVYIAGDTLHHQPIGAGHMTVLQLHGPMAFHVRTTPMLPVKSGSITPAFTSNSYSTMRPDLDINWA